MAIKQLSAATLWPLFGKERIKFWCIPSSILFFLFALCLYLFIYLSYSILDYTRIGESMARDIIFPARTVWCSKSKHSLKGQEIHEFILAEHCLNSIDWKSNKLKCNLFNSDIVQYGFRCFLNKKQIWKISKTKDHKAS